MYVANNRTAKYVKQRLRDVKREIDKCKIIVGDIPTLSMRPVLSCYQNQTKTSQEKKIKGQYTL